MVSWWFNDAVGWLADAILAVITFLWGLLADTAFSTPDVTSLPQVTAITGTSTVIVNVGFVLAVLTAGIVVMARDTVQIRYGVAELAPRLVIGWVGSNFAVPLCGHLIQLANAVTVALTGSGVTAKGSLARIKTVTVDALTNPPSALLAAILGVMVAVLTGMLLVTWIVRTGVLIALVGVAPLALACHATPYSEPAARLWWRALLGTLAVVVVQAFALHTTLAIFLDPDANLAPLGLPQDPTGTLNLFVVVCLLWVVVRIPALMRRYVTRSNGGHNVAGTLVRVLVVQRLTGLLRNGMSRSSMGAGRHRLRGGAGGGSGMPGRRLPPPQGAGPGRVGIAWPTGRPVRPYTPEELAAGVDPYTRLVRRPAPPPIRPAGPRTARRSSAPRPVLPPGVTPATAMPKTRPAHVRGTGWWSSPRSQQT